MVDVMTRRKRIVIGISGASGFDYSVEVLKILSELDVETHLVVSQSALIAMSHESDITLMKLKDLSSHWYDNRDIAAPIASGSFRTEGMIVVPCSAKTLAEIANGIGGNRLSRSAVVVREGRV